MKKLEKDDVILLNDILKLTIVNNEQIKKMEYFMVNFIDPKTSICGHCSAQIRFSHQRIVHWAGANKELIEEVMTGDTNKCKTCGKELTDKRRRDFCSTQCKNK